MKVNQSKEYSTSKLVMFGQGNFVRNNKERSLSATN